MTLQTALHWAIPGLFVLVMGEVYHAHRLERSLAATVGAEPSAPAPVRPALAPEHGGPVTPADDFEEKLEAARKYKAKVFDRCLFGGGHVAMGFGSEVICLKPQCVEWTDDLHWPGLE